MIIKLTNAGFTYGGDKYIFENVNLEINNTDKIGLVGINGTGKSTLLNCITGEFILCDGEIYKKNGLSIGYLRQNSGLESSSTVYDEMLSVFNDVFQIEKKLHALSAEMSTLSYESREYKECADKYNRLTNEFSAKDGYNVEVKVKTILNGMGLSEFYDRVINTLSGGEKTKVALTKLLLISPELLILDEPTNHLDLETLAWLERFLSGYKGAILVVSHDRYFLDKLVNRIWDFEQKTVTDYYANYSKFKTLKTEKFLSWQREYDKQQLQIAKMQDYIDRNGVRASTANMAKSREKQLAQMDVIAKPYVPPRRPRFAFKFSTDASENVLEVRNLTLEYPNRTLLTNQSFIVKRGNKVALLGANGTGKSTLIKKIVNFEPTNGGKIIFGHNVKFSYYDQENLNFSNDGTVMDVMWDINRRATQTEVRSLLASVLLDSDDVFKQVSVLSGGERAKLGLCLMEGVDANFLILDEPTNHLDLDAREALEDAICAYGGTVLFVSHDRYFVNRIAQRVLEISDYKINEYEGNYDSYAEAKRLIAETLCSQSDSVPVVKQTNKQQTTYRTSKQRATDTKRKLLLTSLEKQLEESELRISTLESEMSTPEIANDYQLLIKKSEEYTAEKLKYDELTEQYLVLTTD